MEQVQFNDLMDKHKAAIVTEVEAKADAKVEAAKSAIIVKMDEIDARAKAIEAHVAQQAKFAAPKVDEATLGAKLVSLKDTLAEMKDNRSKSVNFDVKAAANITTGNYTGGTYGLTSLDGEVAKPARRSPFLRQMVRSFPLSTPYVTWTQLVNRDGGAGNTAEGALKSQADFDYVEATKKAEKITAYMKATKESLDDIGRLQSDIQVELLESIALKLDADLLSGTGTTPQIAGILGYAPTFSVAGSQFATGVATPNRYDVVRAARWIIENNYFQANAICLNSIDAAMMDVVKATDGQYLLPDRLLGGLNVVINNGITAGTFLVGDFSKSNLGIREDVTLSIGYENDDFTKNFVTILAEMRAVHYIKSNHVNAFVQGTFSTAITAITKP